MLTYNTMRFMTDEFTPYIKWGLLESNDLALDLTDYSFIERFRVYGSQPTGTQRRFMFKVDGKYYTFDGQNLELYEGEITVDNVLAYGNTAAQVEAVRNIRAWGGKKVYPVIALYTEVEDSPTVRLTAALVQGAEILDFEETRRFTTSTGDQKVLGFEYEPEIVGNASAELTMSYYDGSTWSDYMSLDDIVGKTVRQLNLKYKLHVDAINGINSAKIGKIKLLYTSDTNSIVCGETAELYTIRKNYYLPLKTCAVILKHAALSSGASFDVYLFTTTSVQETKLASIGVGTGNSQTITLSTSKFIRASTFHLFVNGTETTDYNLDTSKNTVTLTAPSGAGISATYAYAIQAEEWTKMTPNSTQRDISDGKYVTRYYAEIDSNKNYRGVVKIVFNRPFEGNPTVVTRTATGAQEQVQLAYAPDNVDCTAETWEVDDETNILTFTGTEGDTVTITYSRQAPNPTLYSFTVGWSV